MDTIIEVKNLSKRYRIGLAAEKSDSLADAIYQTILAPYYSLRNLKKLSSFKEDEEDVLWALKDISFNVKDGEVLGIVGKNGAGKSTLLKILSRITSPTTGSINIKGRVASLLEVGTGFHPELTGRENVYLNGTILGMSKTEVQKKFDEIVNFSGVEKFIDTPVKRYSSGMRVRLAFAVAAHLEPEILIVDEVLSVGDYEFQKKCLGKMHDVAGHGRTVLFVSHNLAAVKSLCTRAILLSKGRLVDSGTPEEIIDTYLKDSLNEIERNTVAETTAREGNGIAKINDFFIINNKGEKTNKAETGEACKFVFEYQSNERQNFNQMFLGFGIRNENDERLTRLDMHDKGLIYNNVPANGKIICEIDKLPLQKGRYIIGIVLYVNGIIADLINHAATFNVEEGEYYKCGVINNNGPVFIDHEWKLKD